ncbi:5-(carboxyamino)imidazole ribonucleotide mutase [Desulfonispora thiosulfatigenes DSM 11270]|uniref:N5-carboxyaminoimidazole ribonucleotide mutase n=1 Tax=Desulfonispora thiosulfatigenes DSM 11270 TaxID=656914 RepID=A0A1W1VE43_DESTI|nr:5-(carboxyamino)imidazole ribonucleotide mutase [Desulfonispora thiosulfatigenes]SMB91595.1 5-(carboxyamino)imidazole ribonucleotide mutase [Desulfonispora thiosulfatigenes DSM 11270]
MAKNLVGIVMGSDSDLKIMKPCIEILKEFNIPYEVIVASAHRTPHRALSYAETADERGLEIIIAGAGAAAHLAGVLASVTTLPVVAVPINSTPLQGLDALYAMVQMPSGVPVATMAINGAKNAALFAMQILAGKYPEYKKLLKSYKTQMSVEVELKDKKVAEELSK